MKLQSKNLYKCDICGNEDEWNKNWSWYGSVAHIDVCPFDIPLACSEGCKDKLQKNIDSGIFVLPVLRSVNGYDLEISKKRKGY